MKIPASTYIRFSAIDAPKNDRRGGKSNETDLKLTSSELKEEGGGMVSVGFTVPGNSPDTPDIKPHKKPSVSLIERMFFKNIQ